MNEALISVIVPVYNVKPYLAKCLDSILTQTYTNLEILLVDDGSTDGSLTICRTYAEKDKRIRLFSQSNMGLSAARNKALEHINGQYVAFVDSDDVILPDMFAVMLEVLRVHDADMTICGMVSDTGLKKVESCSFTDTKIFEGSELLEAYLKTNYIAPTVWNKLYRAELFYSLRFPPIRKNEDAYIAPRLFGNTTKAVYIPHCFYIQTIRDGSLERSAFSKNDLAILECENELREFITEEYACFLSLTAWRKTNAIASQLRKIVMQHVLWRHRKLFGQLLQMLEEEWNWGQMHAEEGTTASVSAQLAHNHAVMFVLKYTFEGFLLKGKRRLKKFLKLFK